MNGGRLPTAA